MSEQQLRSVDNRNLTPEYGFQYGKETIIPQTPNNLYGPAARPVDQQIYVDALTADARDAAAPGQPEAPPVLDQAAELKQMPLRICHRSAQVGQLRQEYLELAA